jgi:7-cyano-7-deazaguanine synthase in queuosine biosynthesis
MRYPYPNNFPVGPSWDKRLIDLGIPDDIDEVAIMVSGGMDSAILYYALTVLNPTKSIKTFCVPRKADNSLTHSINVHKKVAELLGVSATPELIGDENSTDSTSPTRELLESNRFKLVYDGVNHQVPLGFDFDIPEEFNTLQSRGMANGQRPWRLDVPGLRTPFLHLYKYHVIDLFYRLSAESLIDVTHSCTATTEGSCNDCMWCHERAWGFKQLDLTDPVIG